MTSAGADDVIDRVPPARQMAALELLFSHLAPVPRRQQIAGLTDYLASGGGTLAGLFEARSGPRTRGVVLAMIQPGRTAIVWPPRTIDGAAPNLADELLGTASAYLADAGVRIGQSQIELMAAEDDRRLRQAGYEHLADLVYMGAMVESFPRELPGTDLAYEPYGASNHVRLARLVDQTYEGSLDCPQLNGVRDPNDVLESYRATGVFHPAHWLLISRGGADVGCLICADHPPRNMLELIYVGLVPGARRQGLGEQIVRHAQWLAHRARRGQMLTAVDAANDPALRMYARTGFTMWDRRSTYLRIFPDR